MNNYKYKEFTKINSLKAVGQQQNSQIDKAINTFIQNNHIIEFEIINYQTNTVKQPNHGILLITSCMIKYQG